MQEDDIKRRIKEKAIWMKDYIEEFKNNTNEIYEKCNFQISPPEEMDTLPKITFPDMNRKEKLKQLSIEGLEKYTPYRYEGNQANRHILEELSTEENFSAFINRSLEGLDRLLAQNEFTYSFDAAKELKEYQLLHNSVMDYMDKAVITKEGSYVTKRELYIEYKRFCAYAGRHPVSRRKFSDILMSTPFMLQESRPRIDGKQIYAWKDIKIEQRFTNSNVGISIE